MRNLRAFILISGVIGHRFDGITETCLFFTMARYTSIVGATFLSAWHIFFCMLVLSSLAQRCSSVKDVFSGAVHHA